jgi:hypothetical protein
MGCHWNERKRLMAKKKAKARAGSKSKADKKLEESVDKLASEIHRLTERQDALIPLIGRIVSPTDAIDDLTSELRAVRMLLDKEGKFIGMDRERAKRDLKKERTHAPGDEGSLAGSGG